jgi:hypothetical protein
VSRIRNGDMALATKAEKRNILEDPGVDVIKELI